MRFPGWRRGLVRFVSSFFVLLLPLMAHAQKGDETAESHIEKARKYYEDLEYERALEELDRAQRRALTQADTVRILLYEGIVLWEMNRQDEALAAFNAALRTQPTAQLPMTVSPKIEKSFEALRQQLLDASTPVVQSPLQPAIEPPEKHPEPLPTDAMTVASQPAFSAKSSARTRVLVPAITGGALLASGGVFYALARSEHSRIKEGNPSLATLGDVKRSASRGRTFQTVGFSLMGAGLAGLGAATGFYFLGKRADSASLSLGTDGTSAFVHGRWP